jgi:hypothetical protein
VHVSDRFSETWARVAASEGLEAAAERRGAAQFEQDIVEQNDPGDRLLAGLVAGAHHLRFIRDRAWRGMAPQLDLPSVGNRKVCSHGARNRLEKYR